MHFSMIIALVLVALAQVSTAGFIQVVRDIEHGIENVVGAALIPRDTTVTVTITTIPDYCTTTNPVQSTTPAIAPITTPISTPISSPASPASLATVSTPSTPAAATVPSTKVSVSSTAAAVPATSTTSTGTGIATTKATTTASAPATITTAVAKGEGVQKLPAGLFIALMAVLVFASDI